MSKGTYLVIGKDTSLVREETDAEYEARIKLQAVVKAQQFNFVPRRKSDKKSLNRMIQWEKGIRSPKQFDSVRNIVNDEE